MIMVERFNGQGMTLEDLRAFIEECKALPGNISVKICQTEDTIESDIKDMKADDDGVVFYDWL